MALEGESAAQEWYKDAVLKQLSATIAADVQMLTAQHQIDTMRSAMVEIALILYRRQYHKEEEDLKTLLLSLKPEAFEAFPELIKRLTAASTRQEAKSAIITFVQDLSAPPPDLGPPEDLG